jgi:hypothetical protein
MGDDEPGSLASLRIGRTLDPLTLVSALTVIPPAAVSSAQDYIATPEQ